MQGFAATKLTEFEQGKISRRTLIETLTLAVTSMCASKALNSNSLATCWDWRLITPERCFR